MSIVLPFNDIKNLVERPEIIVSDWDGVVQNIDTVWALLVNKNRELFKDYFDASKFYNKCNKESYVEMLVNRDTYYINRWMMKDGVEPNKELDNLFMRLYTESEDFYEHCPFTPLAEGLAMLCNQNFCQKIIFLSHVPKDLNNGHDERKVKAFNSFIERFNISNDKVELVMIPSDMKKSTWIAENVPNYTCFIDDRHDIIEDVIDNTDSKFITVFMPAFGYSMYPLVGNTEFMDKVRENKIKFHYIQKVYNDYTMPESN